MISAADIPPGGEGEIKVSLKTGRKRGSQMKSVTVSSNDPKNPSVRLQIKAFIEVEFDFQGYSISMGDIPQDETRSKTTDLLVKDTASMKIAGFEISSEFIHAKLLDSGITRQEGYFAIPVEVTVTPGLPPGNFRCVVATHPVGDTSKERQLVVIGDILGDIVLEPDKIAFTVYDSPEKQNQIEQTVLVRYKAKDKPLEIKGVRLQGDYLDVTLDTLKDNSEYEIVARVKDEYIVNSNNYSGYIVLKTNDPDESSVRIRYQIYHNKQ